MVILADVETRALNSILPNEDGLWWRDPEWLQPEGHFALNPRHWFMDYDVRFCLFCSR